MKKILSIVALTTLATSVYSYQYNYGYGNQNNSNSSYESSFGNKYQYDMSDPSDRIDYSFDFDAQMRDRLSVEPTRNLDRGLGEYGRGIYD
ncbi:MAG: hypothetical protein FE834_08825 [Gammaproteobacteria bacterium]|nr:hypothetical protein [Gammaproteobacteria bacterium]